MGILTCVPAVRWPCLCALRCPTWWWSGPSFPRTAPSATGPSTALWRYLDHKTRGLKGQGGCSGCSVAGVSCEITPTAVTNTVDFLGLSWHGALWRLDRQGWKHYRGPVWPKGELAKLLLKKMHQDFFYKSQWMTMWAENWKSALWNPSYDELASTYTPSALNLNTFNLFKTLEITLLSSASFK